MRKSLSIFTVLAATVTSGAVHARDSTYPTPPPKPLGTPSHPSFLEGIDIPPAKPSPKSLDVFPDSAPTIARTAATCHIEDALFEFLEPEKGDGPWDTDLGCGIENPIRLTGLLHEKAAVSFAAPVTVSCDFAGTLSDWLQRDVLSEARARFGKSVASLSTGPGYQCRRRNNLTEGKLSEHALGKAVDITSFQLSDGQQISVQTDWGQPTEKGQFLKAVHGTACKRFTTVLGPDADPNHRSHIHLDVGCHGKDCTYIICQ